MTVILATRTSGDGVARMVVWWHGKVVAASACVEAARRSMRRKGIPNRQNHHRHIRNVSWYHAQGQFIHPRLFPANFMQFRRVMVWVVALRPLVSV
jgi:hypothetical protein